jgi:hypothetical protein
LKAECGLAGFINFADKICKPGRLLEYDVYEDHSHNGNGNNRVNDAYNNEENENFCFAAHIIGFPCSIGLRSIIKTLNFSQNIAQHFVVIKGRQQARAGKAFAGQDEHLFALIFMQDSGIASPHLYTFPGIGQYD